MSCVGFGNSLFLKKQIPLNFAVLQVGILAVVSS